MIQEETLMFGGSKIIRCYVSELQYCGCGQLRVIN